MLKKIGIGVLAIIAVIIGAFLVYVNNDYEADYVASTIYLENNNSLEYVGEDKEYGFIIYPGGKVEEVAYMRFAKLMSETGYTTVVAKFPFNIGFLGINKADEIMAEHSDVEKWVIIGHSLGGVAGAVYANENPEKVDSLVFLSSYSTEDLTDTDINVLSIKASNDTVLNEEGYEAALVNYDKENNNFSRTLIQGGNHAGYANYGEQEGDGVNELGSEVQQTMVRDAIVAFLEEVNQK